MRRKLAQGTLAVVVLLAGLGGGAASAGSGGETLLEGVRQLERSQTRLCRLLEADYASERLWNRACRLIVAPPIP